MDIKIQHIEKRIDNLYDDLRKYEDSINTRLTSLDETKVLYAKLNEQVMSLSSKLDMFYSMITKNDTKLEQICEWKDT